MVVKGESVEFETHYLNFVYAKAEWDLFASMDLIEDLWAIEMEVPI